MTHRPHSSLGPCCPLRCRWSATRAEPIAFGPESIQQPTGEPANLGHQGTGGAGHFTDVAVSELAAQLFGAFSTKAEAQLRAALGQHLTFRSANPTGHYELSLSSPVDHSVCSRLIDLAREEVRPLSHTNQVAFDSSFRVCPVTLLRRGWLFLPHDDRTVGVGEYRAVLRSTCAIWCMREVWRRVVRTMKRRTT